MSLLISLLKNKVSQAVQELESWVETYAPSSEERQWYQNVKEHLLYAQKATSIEELQNRAGVITRMIIDSGPLDKDFMPSFQDLLQKLGKLNK